jgi:hypothetical protein
MDPLEDGEEACQVGPEEPRESFAYSMESRCQGIGWSVKHKSGSHIVTLSRGREETSKKKDKRKKSNSCSTFIGVKRERERERQGTPQGQQIETRQLNPRHIGVEIRICIQKMKMVVLYLMKVTK